MKYAFLLLLVTVALFGKPFEMMSITNTPRPSPAYNLHQIDVLDYEITFRFDVPADTLGVNVTITFVNLAEEDTSFAFDLEDIMFIPESGGIYDENTGNWLWLPITYNDSIIWLHTDSLPLYDTVKVAMWGIISPLGTGAYSEPGFDSDIVYTLFWPSLARRIFPCIDHPADRATCTLRLTVPENLTVAAGGMLADSVASGHSGYVQWTFRYDEPVCTYNISFAVGNYAAIETTALDSLPVKSYAYPSQLAATEYDFGRIPEMLALFDSLFGAYPFPRVGCVVTPLAAFGGAGGMEHQMLPNIGQGLITGSRTYEEIVAHELSHQWFGDCIGIADWRDFWLNEGIATYSEVLWTEHIAGTSAAKTYMDAVETAYLNYTDWHGDFPMHDPDIYLSYVPYNKGGCWWRMLRWMLGDDDFFEFLQYYYERFEYKTVVTDSLHTALEDFTLNDWDWYFDQWVYDRGYPKYSYDYSINRDRAGWRLDVHIQQTQTSPSCTLFTNPIPLIITSPDSTTYEIRITPVVRDYRTTISLDDTIYSVEFDPNNVICGRFTHDPSMAEEDITLPEELDILVYPNPFNSSCRISLSCHSRESGNPGRVVAMEIFDINGRTVAEIPVWADLRPTPMGVYQTLPYEITWLPDESISSGVYFIRARVGKKTITKRIVLLR